jgi:predicted XRE-type DNA-binding protein
MKSEGTKVRSIFEQLGFANHDEMVAKADLAIQINAIIKTRKFSCEAVAQMLNVSETEIVALHKGRLMGFTLENLCKYLKLLQAI